MICGIIMPISAIDGCSESHWSDVHEILNEAIEDAGFEANLVSNADDVGIIQKRIIQNLYDNPVVVCDVSGKNPNVMFELGMRLAFDRPTIIVKDDKTSYAFDTSPIEHLEYPRDLRFGQIVEFKEKLQEKIQNTYKKSTTDANYTTFLKHFGEFKVAKIEQREVSSQELILDELRSLREAINRQSKNDDKPRPATRSGPVDVCLRGVSDAVYKALVASVEANPSVQRTETMFRADHNHLTIVPKKPSNAPWIRQMLRKEFPEVKIRVKDEAEVKDTSALT
jgi:hypothetical protein